MTEWWGDVNIKKPPPLQGETIHRKGGTREGNLSQHQRIDKVSTTGGLFAKTNPTIIIDD